MALDSHWRQQQTLRALGPHPPYPQGHTAVAHPRQLVHCRVSLDRCKAQGGGGGPPLEQETQAEAILGSLISRQLCPHLGEEAAGTMWPEGGVVPTSGISLLPRHGGQVLDDLVHVQQVALRKQDGAALGAACYRHGDQGHQRMGGPWARWGLVTSQSALFLSEEQPGPRMGRVRPRKGSLWPRWPQVRGGAESACSYLTLRPSPGSPSTQRHELPKARTGTRVCLGSCVAQDIMSTTLVQPDRSRPQSVQLRALWPRHCRAALLRTPHAHSPGTEHTCPCVPASGVGQPTGAAQPAGRSGQWAGEEGGRAGRGWHGVAREAGGVGKEQTLGPEASGRCAARSAGFSPPLHCPASS